MTTIEDLNKTQLILLTLLVTFVTSIGTGIITASLLAEAPVSVTQTINRVVERTIETVAPAPLPKEVTLKNEDRLLLAAVDRAAQNVVRIQEKTENSTTTPVSFLGVIATKDGFVVSALDKVQPGKSYIAVLADDSRLSLTLATTSPQENIAIFKIRSEAVTGGSVSEAQ